MLNNEIDIKIEKTKSEPTHINRRVEIIYLLEGKVCVVINGEKSYLEKSDVIIINSGESNSITTLSEGIVCRILIDNMLLEHMLGSGKHTFKCDSSKSIDDRYNELRIMLNRLLNSYLQNASSISFIHIGMYFEILEFVTKNFLVSSISINALDKGDEYKKKRIEKIVNYIEKNYANKITLKDLAEKLYLTDSHLSRMIKKELKTGFRGYLTKVRLRHAVDDLTLTDKPLINVALDNGFSSQAMFNKVFKESYEMTPNEYRRETKISREKNLKKQKELEKEALLKVDKYIKEFNDDQNITKSKSHIDVNVDVLDTTKYMKPWQSAINVGIASDLLNGKMQKHIVKLKSELDFTYIRFWGVFYEEMMILPNSKDGISNYDKLDDVIGFLLNNRLKPFFQLGSKPRTIIREAGTIDLLSGASSYSVLDLDIEGWERLITSLMKHLVSQFGTQEVETWIFEMWAPCKWDGEYYEKYTVEHYSVFYKSVKKYAPNALVGGMEFTPCEHNSRMDEIVEEWRKSDAVPDFISYSAFPYFVDWEIEKKPKWITNPNWFKNLIKETNQLMRTHGLTEKKLFMTTWNITISNRNILNDTVYKGAYIIKNSIDSVNNVDMLVYWLCSDIYSEYIDSRGMLFGGTGIMSKDGIYKPSFYAFSFLKRLNLSLIEKGENYIITRNDYDNYTIIYHNLKKLNYNVYLKPEDSLTYNDLESLYEETESKSLSFKLKNVNEELYNVRIQKVNEQYGSILDEWHHMGHFDVLPKEEQNYLEKVSIPKKKFYRKNAEKGTISIDLNALPNEFGLIEIFPVTS